MSGKICEAKMMSHPLDGPRRKLHWAGEHLKQIHTELDTWSHVGTRPGAMRAIHLGDGGGGPYRASSEIEAATGDRVWHVHVLREPPPDLPLLIGDFVQNARAALDHLAFQLGMLTTHPNEPKGTQFPICTNRETYPDSRTKGQLKNIWREAWPEIKALQPFPETNNYPLGWLGALSNTDKHKVVHVVSCTLPQIRDYVFRGGDPEPNIISPSGVELADGAEIARLPSRTNDPEMLFEPRFAYDMVFGDIGVRVPGLPLGISIERVLTDIEAFVRDGAFPRFNRFFK